MASSNDGRPKPSAVIRSGAVSGVLPEAEVFAVHYPGYPSSTARAIDTLGGLQEIAKVRSLDSPGSLELRFRPDDPYCHPAFGELRACSGLLIKISKSREGDDGFRCRNDAGTREEAEPSGSCAGDGGEDGEPPLPECLSAEVVARVKQAYCFEGMVDYQHVLAVHAAEARRKKRPWASEEELDLENYGNTGMDEADVMMLVPPLFSIKDRPENIVLNSSVNLFSKNMQTCVVEHRWEMDIEPCLAIAFDIEIKVNWEDNISKDTTEWEWQMVVCKLFDERPIWPRWSLYERLLDDGLQVSEQQLKRLLFRAGYYFSTGPFGRFWIKKGYDPRNDPESRIFQKVDFRVPPRLRDYLGVNGNAKSKSTIKDMCRFQVLPSKMFVCLQFFELEDDFIQKEIRKPSQQTVCTHATGWFSRPMLKTLRLHVSIRLLSLFPNKAAEDLVNDARELFERSKKEEALSRFQKLQKENQEGDIDSESSALVPLAESIENEPEIQDQPNDGEIEDEEDEEDELDEYESPAVAQEDDRFTADGGSYNIGESIPSDYLKELLRGFPFNKDGEGSQSNDAVQGAGLSDGEYQIYEQDSDDDENS